MTTATSALTLRVHGALYLLEIEVEKGGLDWLARVILEVTERPRSVSELMRCFGLPRRMLEDAIAQLIESHMLLLDVARGEVRTSGLPIAVPSVRRSETDLLVWQDYFSGTILPWSAVRPYCQAKLASGAGPIEDLIGGPPRRHVLEMSDAELLTHLERFRPGATWSEVIARRERVDRRATMLLKAERDEEGRITIFDPIPRTLIRQWGRRAQSGVRMPAATRVELPQAWSRIVAEWSADTSRRIDVLEARKEADTTQSVRLFGRLREVIERHSRLELHDNPARKLRQRVVEGDEGGGHHRIVLSTSGTTDAWAAGIELWRKARAEQKKALRVRDKQKPKSSQGDTVAQVGGEMQMSSRSDVELWLLDDRELWVGGQLPDRPLALCLRSAWPLQPLLAWLPESFSWDAASFPRAQSAEYGRSYAALTKVAALQDGLREIEAALSATDAPPPAGELIEQLRHDVEAIEKGLNALALHQVIALDYLEVGDILEERRGARLLVRDLASPLAAFREGHELIVWSTEKPAPSNRWLNEPGACEVAVVDDVVVFGWWQYPGDDDSAPPPFFAVHAREVSAALRARSDNAMLVEP